VIVYGDRERDASAEDVLASLLRQLDEAALALDLTQREALATLLIDLGSLAQALEDRAFAQRGEDELSPLADVCARATLQAGRAFVAHHRARAVDFGALRRALDALRGHATGRLRLRDPEGFAFYALYPELYVEACAALGADAVQVIGIRSIGSSLAGLVAAALDTPLLPRSVRPVAHPFARELRIGPALRDSLLAPGRTYAIVDEGPGLSGSSFEAVMQYLRERGVARERIVLLPSHAGEPGRAADDARRARYRATRKHLVQFEQYFDGSTPARDLRQWFEAHTGSPRAPLQTLSAGRWRAWLYPEVAGYPASAQGEERRKYLLEGERGSFLLKYVGLGSGARRIAARARVLSEAGFTPRLIDVRHGFALSELAGGALPLSLTEATRPTLIEFLARYLAFLTRTFPADASRGADPAQLLAMARQNTRELLGSEALERHDDELAELRSTQRVIEIDGKLDLCEWLVTPEGRLLKCDAEAHHAGHDCIGCQDPAWDLAGAVIELDLQPEELERVREAIWDQAHYRCSDRKLRFYELAYAAFRAGRAQMSADGMRGWADDDAARMDRERARYVAALALRV
jgi:hypothetical protein